MISLIFLANGAPWRFHAGDTIHHQAPEILTGFMYRPEQSEIDLASKPPVRFLKGRVGCLARFPVPDGLLEGISG
jgi:hypothetical protein